MPYYRFRIKGSTVRSILKSKKAYPAKSANQEDTAEKLSRVLRVDDEIYSQICFLETTANALQHYLCDEEFIKDESKTQMNINDYCIFKRKYKNNQFLYCQSPSYDELPTLKSAYLPSFL